MIEIINLSELSNLFGGGTDFCKKMRDIYIEKYDMWNEREEEMWLDVYSEHCIN